MEQMSFLGWIVIGGLAGWIASKFMGTDKDQGLLANIIVGVIGAFPLARRKELFTELQPLVTTFDDHPWAWAKQQEGGRTPRNSEFSRWNNGKDLSFTPLRPELVVEVRYEHMEGVRFRHTAQFNRWRPDRDPRTCTYAQLEDRVNRLANLWEGLGVGKGDRVLWLGQNSLAVLEGVLACSALGAMF